LLYKADIIIPENWLRQEYGPIFNKVIMVEPVMQKVRPGSGSKLPSNRFSNVLSPGEKRRMNWMSRLKSQMNEDKMKTF